MIWTFLLVVLPTISSSTPSEPFEKNSWALLVAGSNTWENYRHQADIAHAYHVLVREGIPVERIIVMMYDDIANNSFLFYTKCTRGFQDLIFQTGPCPGPRNNVFSMEKSRLSDIPPVWTVNDPVTLYQSKDQFTHLFCLTRNPVKGQIINKPKGPNVYEGLKIDYSGDTVNSTNFLNVLSGDKSAMKGIGTGRVIESTNKTNVFVNFAGHGSAGLLEFPNDFLLYYDLHETLSEMHSKKQYHKMVIYVEACESGALFSGILEEKHKIFAVTAAARDEDSYAVYCKDEVRGCIGDEFSVRWMEHMDSRKKGIFETFFHQYQKVRSVVSMSHVQMYGDFRIGTNGLTPNKNAVNASETWKETSVNSRDVPLMMAKLRVLTASGQDRKMNKIKLNEMIKARKIGKKVISELVSLACNGDRKLEHAITTKRLQLNLKMAKCYKNLISSFQINCFGHENKYFLRHFYKFANICILNLNTTIVRSSMSRVCHKVKVQIKTTVL